MCMCSLASLIVEWKCSRRVPAGVYSTTRRDLAALAQPQCKWHDMCCCTSFSAGKRSALERPGYLCFTFSIGGRFTLL